MVQLSTTTKCFLGPIFYFVKYVTNYVNATDGVTIDTLYDNTTEAPHRTNLKELLFTALTTSSASGGMGLSSSILLGNNDDQGLKNYIDDSLVKILTLLKRNNFTALDRSLFTKEDSKALKKFMININNIIKKKFPIEIDTNTFSPQVTDTQITNHNTNVAGYLDLVDDIIESANIKNSGNADILHVNIYDVFGKAVMNTFSGYDSSDPQWKNSYVTQSLIDKINKNYDENNINFLFRSPNHDRSEAVKKIFGFYLQLGCEFLLANFVSSLKVLVKEAKKSNYTWSGAYASNTISNVSTGLTALPSTIDNDTWSTFSTLLEVGDSFLVVSKPVIISSETGLPLILKGPNYIEIEQSTQISADATASKNIKTIFGEVYFDSSKNKQIITINGLDHKTSPYESSYSVKSTHNTLIKVIGKPGDPDDGTGGSSSDELGVNQLLLGSYESDGETLKNFIVAGQQTIGGGTNKDTTAEYTFEVVDKSWDLRKVNTETSSIDISEFSYLTFNITSYYGNANGLKPKEFKSVKFHPIRVTPLEFTLNNEIILSGNWSVGDKVTYELNGATALTNDLDTTKTYYVKTLSNAAINGQKKITVSETVGGTTVTFDDQKFSSDDDKKRRFVNVSIMNLGAGYDEGETKATPNNKIFENEVFNIKLEREDDVETKTEKTYKYKLTLSRPHADYVMPLGNYKIDIQYNNDNESINHGRRPVLEGQTQSVDPVYADLPASLKIEGTTDNTYIIVSDFYGASLGARDNDNDAEGNSMEVFRHSDDGVISIDNKLKPDPFAGSDFTEANYNLPSIINATVKTSAGGTNIPITFSSPHGIYSIDFVSREFISAYATSTTALNALNNSGDNNGGDFSTRVTGSDRQAEIIWTQSSDDTLYIFNVDDQSKTSSKSNIEDKIANIPVTNDEYDIETSVNFGWAYSQKLHSNKNYQSLAGTGSDSVERLTFRLTNNFGETDNLSFDIKCKEADRVDYNSFLLHNKGETLVLKAGQTGAGLQNAEEAGIETATKLKKNDENFWSYYVSKGKVYNGFFYVSVNKGIRKISVYSTINETESLSTSFKISLTETNYANEIETLINKDTIADNITKKIYWEYTVPEDVTDSQGDITTVREDEIIKITVKDWWDDDQDLILNRWYVDGGTQSQHLIINLIDDESILTSSTLQKSLTISGEPIIGSTISIENIDIDDTDDKDIVTTFKWLILPSSTSLTTEGIWDDADVESDENSAGAQPKSSFIIPVVRSTVTSDHNAYVKIITTDKYGETTEHIKTFGLVTGESLITLKEKKYNSANATHVNNITDISSSSVTQQDKLVINYEAFAKRTSSSETNVPVTDTDKANLFEYKWQHQKTTNDGWYDIAGETTNELDLNMGFNAGGRSQALVDRKVRCVIKLKSNDVVYPEQNKDESEWISNAVTITNVEQESFGGVTVTANPQTEEGATFTAVTTELDDYDNYVFGNAGDLVRTAGLKDWNTGTADLAYEWQITDYVSGGNAVTDQSGTVAIDNSAISGTNQHPLGGNATSKTFVLNDSQVNVGKWIRVKVTTTDARSSDDSGTTVHYSAWQQILNVNDVVVITGDYSSIYEVSSFGNKWLLNGETTYDPLRKYTLKGGAPAETSAEFTLKALQAEANLLFSWKIANNKIIRTQFNVNIDEVINFNNLSELKTKLGGAIFITEFASENDATGTNIDLDDFSENHLPVEGGYIEIREPEEGEERLIINPLIQHNRVIQSSQYFQVSPYGNSASIGVSFNKLEIKMSKTAINTAISNSNLPDIAGRSENDAAYSLIIISYDYEGIKKSNIEVYLDPDTAADEYIIDFSSQNTINTFMTAHKDSRATGAADWIYKNSDLSEIVFFGSGEQSMYADPNKYSNYTNWDEEIMPNVGDKIEIRLKYIPPDGVEGEGKNHALTTGDSLILTQTILGRNYNDGWPGLTPTTTATDLTQPIPANWTDDVPNLFSFGDIVSSVTVSNEPVDYILKNVPTSHPIAILNHGKTDQITYTGSTSVGTKAVTGTTADASYQFYTGDVTITVEKDFGEVSLYCYNHGYMGGKNILNYDSNTGIEPGQIAVNIVSVSTTTGNITFTDEDRKPFDENGKFSETHTASATLVSMVAKRSNDDVFYTHGTSDYDDAIFNATHYADLSSAFSVVIEDYNDQDDGISSGSPVTRKAVWKYAIEKSKFDFLAKDETVEIHYNVTIDDNNGSTATQLIKLKITGDNQNPVLSGTEVSGNIAENNANLADRSYAAVSGTLTFVDVDLSDQITPSIDTQTVTYKNSSDQTIAVDPTTVWNTGKEAAFKSYFTIPTAAQSNTGTVRWTFQVPTPTEGESDVLDFIGQGQTVTIVSKVKVADNKGGSDEKDVTIVITGTNDAPVIAVGSAAILDPIDKGTSLEIPKATFLLGWSDPDNLDTLSIYNNSITIDGTKEAGGSISVNGTYDEWTLTPAPEAVGNGALNYKVSDGLSHINAIISFYVREFEFETNEDESFQITRDMLLAGWNADENTEISNISLSDSGAGTLSNTTNSKADSYRYTPTENYNTGSGNITINYTIKYTGTSRTNKTTSIKLKVKPVNDAPELSGSAFTFSNGIQYQQYTITKANLLQGWTDVDNNAAALIISQVEVSGNIIAADAEDKYKFTPSTTGDLTINYKVSDPNGGEKSNAITINIAEPPTTIATLTTGLSTRTSNEDEALSVTKSELFTGWTPHIPNSTLQINGDSITIKDNNGTNVNASISYDSTTETYSITPPENSNGSFTINYNVTYTGSEPAAGVAAQVDWTVTPVNDAPALKSDAWTGAAALPNGTVGTEYTFTATQLKDQVIDPDNGSDQLSVHNDIDDADYNVTLMRLNDGQWEAISGHFIAENSGTYTFMPDTYLQGLGDLRISYYVEDSVNPAARSAQLFTNTFTFEDAAVVVPLQITATGALPGNPEPYYIVIKWTDDPNHHTSDDLSDEHSAATGHKWYTILIPMATDDNGDVITTTVTLDDAFAAGGGYTWAGGYPGDPTVVDGGFSWTQTTWTTFFNKNGDGNTNRFRLFVPGIDGTLVTRTTENNGIREASPINWFIDQNQPEWNVEWLNPITFNSTAVDTAYDYVEYEYVVVATHSDEENRDVSLSVTHDLPSGSTLAFDDTEENKLVGNIDWVPTSATQATEVDAGGNTVIDFSQPIVYANPTYNITVTATEDGTEDDPVTNTQTYQLTVEKNNDDTILYNHNLKSQGNYLLQGGTVSGWNDQGQPTTRPWDFGNDAPYKRYKKLLTDVAAGNYEIAEINMSSDSELLNSIKFKIFYREWKYSDPTGGAGSWQMDSNTEKETVELSFDNGELVVKNFSFEVSADLNSAEIDQNRYGVIGIKLIDYANYLKPVENVAPIAWEAHLHTVKVQLAQALNTTLTPQNKAEDSVLTVNDAETQSNGMSWMESSEESGGHGGHSSDSSDEHDGHSSSPPPSYENITINMNDIYNGDMYYIKVSFGDSNHTHQFETTPNGPGGKPLENDIVLNGGLTGIIWKTEGSDSNGLPYSEPAGNWWEISQDYTFKVEIWKNNAGAQEIDIDMTVNTLSALFSGGSYTYRNNDIDHFVLSGDLVSSSGSSSGPPPSYENITINMDDTYNSDGYYIKVTFGDDHHTHQFKTVTTNLAAEPQVTPLANPIVLNSSLDGITWTDGVVDGTSYSAVGDNWWEIPEDYTFKVEIYKQGVSGPDREEWAEDTLSNLFSHGPYTYSNPTGTDHFVLSGDLVSSSSSSSSSESRVITIQAFAAANDALIRIQWENTAFDSELGASQSNPYSYGITIALDTPSPLTTLVLDNNTSIKSYEVGNQSHSIWSSGEYQRPDWWSENWWEDLIDESTKIKLMLMADGAQLGGMTGFTTISSILSETPPYLGYYTLSTQSSGDSSSSDSNSGPSNYQNITITVDEDYSAWQTGSGDYYYLHVTFGDDHHAHKFTTEDLYNLTTPIILNDNLKDKDEPDAVPGANIDWIIGDPGDGTTYTAVSDGWSIMDSGTKFKVELWKKTAADNGSYTPSLISNMDQNGTLSDIFVGGSLVHTHNNNNNDLFVIGADSVSSTGSGEHDDGEHDDGDTSTSNGSEEHDDGDTSTSTGSGDTSTGTTPVTLTISQTGFENWVSDVYIRGQYTGPWASGDPVVDLDRSSDNTLVIEITSAGGDPNAPPLSIGGNSRGFSVSIPSTTNEVGTEAIFNSGYILDTTSTPTTQDHDPREYLFASYIESIKVNTGGNIEIKLTGDFSVPDGHTGPLSLDIWYNGTNVSGSGTEATSAGEPLYQTKLPNISSDSGSGSSSSALSIDVVSTDTYTINTSHKINVTWTVDSNTYTFLDSVGNRPLVINQDYGQGLTWVDNGAGTNPENWQSFFDNNTNTITLSIVNNDNSSTLVGAVTGVISEINHANFSLTYSNSEDEGDGHGEAPQPNMGAKFVVSKDTGEPVGSDPWISNKVNFTIQNITSSTIQTGIFRVEYWNGSDSWISVDTDGTTSASTNFDLVADGGKMLAYNSAADGGYEDNMNYIYTYQNVSHATGTKVRLVYSANGSFDDNVYYPDIGANLSTVLIEGLEYPTMA